MIKKFSEFIKQFERFAYYEYGKESSEQSKEDLWLILDKDDDLNAQFVDLDRMLLEWETYQPFPPTKCVYRIDKANNAVGQQKHIHVYADRQHQHQLYAINLDGTPHDGSKYQLNKKHQDALTKLGFQFPADGLLEWLDWSGCRLLTD